MDWHEIKKKILDTPLRQIYHELNGKFLLKKQTDVFEEFSPVFVLSTGRVGTETLDALFQPLGSIFSYHEPKPSLYRLSKAAYEYEKESLAENILQEAFLTARTDLFQYSLACHKGYVETSPQVTFLAPIVLKIIPNAKFIHLARDPRDVIRSGMRRKWFDGHPNDPTRIVPRPDSSHSPLWARYSPFQKNVWLWNETNHWILEFSKALATNQFLFLRSEDMFAGKSDILANLFAFLDVPSPSSMKINQVLNKKLNAQKSGEFPSATSWTDEMKAFLLEVADDTATQLGYHL